MQSCGAMANSDQNAPAATPQTDPKIKHDIDPENMGRHTTEADVPVAPPPDEPQPKDEMTGVPEGDRVTVDPTDADKEVLPDEYGYRATWTRMALQMVRTNRKGPQDRGHRSGTTPSARRRISYSEICNSQFVFFRGFI